MIHVIETSGLTLHISPCPGSRRVAYILYPMEALGGWLAQAATKYRISMVSITGMDWDNDLSPWPAPGEPPGSPDFQGLAPEFLATLTQKVAPAAEEWLGLTGAERILTGVSMSGLFALWQRFVSPFFPTVLSLSGSFWYPGFVEFVNRQAAPQPTGSVYMLLGRKERFSPIKAFRRVEDDTRLILARLQQLGVPCRLDMVPGNHYANPLPRLDLAFSSLTQMR